MKTSNSNETPKKPGQLIQTLGSKLLLLSDLLVRAESHTQDTFGNACDVHIRAVRRGRKCLLISHFPNINDPDSPEQITIEEVCSTAVALPRALKLFKAFYETITPGARLDSAWKLKDKTTEVGHLLDGLYEPSPKIPAVKPSSILKCIIRRARAEEFDLWAWSRQVLYLTKYHRAFFLREYVSFDKSLELLFTALKFKVKCVPLNSPNRERFQEEIVAYLRKAKVDALKSAIAQQEAEIERLHDEAQEAQSHLDRLEARGPCGFARIPQGHVEVARYCEDETNLQAGYLSILSRNEKGGYTLTQYIGKYLVRSGSPCNHFGRHRVRRQVTQNEAVIWLERELHFCKSRGDSAYCKHFFSLNRSEIRRLIAGNGLQSYFYGGIHRLLLEEERGKAGKARLKLRKEIPNGRISFARLRKSTKPEQTETNA